MPIVRRCRQPGCHAMVNFPDHYCQHHYEHEAEYLANHERWARSHDKHYTHKYNTVTRSRDATKREQYNFYRTQQWAHLRQQALDRDYYLCQYCKTIGMLTANSQTVDHIVPMEVQPNSKADINNLAVICRQCHHKKHPKVRGIKIVTTILIPLLLYLNGCKISGIGGHANASFLLSYSIIKGRYVLTWYD